VTDRPAAAYVDATAGVAGDMLLAALLDAGADVERVSGAIASLRVPGLGLRTEAARRGGLACLRAVIITPSATDRPRHLADVLGHVGASDLRPAAKDLATRVFRLLAEAEGAVHGEPPEDVHFHEVGAFDSMADVVGSAAALEDLGLLRPGAVVRRSALAAGSGFVTSAHGRLPVPAPAVLRIAAAAGLDLAGGDLAGGDLTGERTTPTGAALLAAAAAPGGFPAMTVRAVGIGGGGRDTPDRPNITRVVIGESSAERDLREGDVTVVESTVDDLDPRLWPSVLQAVRAAGAWDCWCTPIVGRHGRPGQVLTALCSEPVRRAVAAAIFAHTGTLGVRWSRMSRLTASRTSVAVEVGPPGSGQVVTVKVADTTDGLAGFGTATAELAEAEAAARALGWPVRAVCEAAVAQYRAQATVPRLHQVQDLRVLNRAQAARRCASTGGSIGGWTQPQASLRHPTIPTTPRSWPGHTTLSPHDPDGGHNHVNP
jgi:pyridinium-3,5-bisthiocarboxylic acid mononucleotide nickel chelatase